MCYRQLLPLNFYHIRTKGMNVVIKRTGSAFLKEDLFSENLTGVVEKAGSQLRKGLISIVDFSLCFSMVAIAAFSNRLNAP